jgi:hypothetical protein
MVDDFPLQSLFNHARLNEQGKVVARTPGQRLGDAETRQSAMRAAMLQHAAVRHFMLGQAVIEPARQAIVQEHEATAESIVPLLEDSPFVPEDRRVLYSLGLAAGFRRDYRTAAHLLVPQLENSVRHILASNGAIVSGLDSEGIQRERDLNALLFDDITKAVFTAGIAFDLQALLVDQAGANFRNRLAHGLLSDSASNSPEAAYTFWMAMHLIEAFRVGAEALVPEPEDGAEGANIP